MTTLHELVPGLLLALADDRDADAIELARAIAEDLGTPELAAIHVGIAANLLHRRPRTSLPGLAVALHDEDVELVDHRTVGDLAERLLTALAEDLNDGGRSDETDQFFAEFDLRPGSSYVVERMVQIVETVIGETTLRTAVALADPAKAVEIQNAALSRVRAAIADGRGPDA